MSIYDVLDTRDKTELKEDIDNNVKSIENIKNEIEGIKSSSGKYIVATKEQFYSSSSPIILSGGEWIDKQPEWTDGKYIWRRTLITYGDESFEYTPSEEGVCITGNTGSDGVSSVMLQITSSNGIVFKNNSIDTNLYVTIIVADKTITTSDEMYLIFGESSYIQWEVKPLGSDNFIEIPQNDDRISDNGFVLNLNPDDVSGQAVFNCSLIY